MRVPKASWVMALRALCGAEANIRFNEAVGRWEFQMPEADGVIRSQFWGWYVDPNTGQRVPVDETTGMPPFRDLDDDSMREALANLERTYVGNPHDGAGSSRKEIERRIAFNDALRADKYRRGGELFADMWAERRRRIQGNPMIQVIR